MEVPARMFWHDGMSLLPKFLVSNGIHFSTSCRAQFPARRHPRPLTFQRRIGSRRRAAEPAAHPEGQHDKSRKTSCSRPTEFPDLWLNDPPRLLHHRRDPPRPLFANPHVDRRHPALRCHARSRWRRHRKGQRISAAYWSQTPARPALWGYRTSSCPRTARSPGALTPGTPQKNEPTRPRTRRDSGYNSPPTPDSSGKTTTRPE